MAQVLDCSPLYTGRPDFEVEDGGSSIPSYTQSRSRLKRGGTFFRSKLIPTFKIAQTLADSDEVTADNVAADSSNLAGGPDSQSLDCNDISLRVFRPNAIEDRIDLVVYFRGVEVERYIVTQDINCTAPGNPPPPAGLGNNVAIPALRAATASSDFISMPGRGTDAQDLLGEDNGCLSEFADTNMSGGSGVPDADIPNIKTGPERTIAFITLFENANGTLVIPPLSDKLVQFDYDNEVFTPYVPNADCRI